MDSKMGAKHLQIPLPLQRGWSNLLGPCQLQAIIEKPYQNTKWNDLWVCWL